MSVTDKLTLYFALPLTTDLSYATSTSHQRSRELKHSPASNILIFTISNTVYNQFSIDGCSAIVARASDDLRRVNQNEGWVTATSNSVQTIFSRRTLRNSLHALNRARTADIIEGHDLNRFLTKSVSFLDSYLANLLFKQNPTIVDYQFIRQENENENGIKYKNIAHKRQKTLGTMSGMSNCCVSVLFQIQMLSQNLRLPKLCMTTSMMKSRKKSLVSL